MNEQTTLPAVAGPSPELLASVNESLAVAKSYRIECVEMREAASVDLASVKRLAKDLEAKRKTETIPLDVEKARVMALYRLPTQYLETAESTLKAAILQWDREQERQRREAEAKARMIADEERRRLETAAAEERAKGNAETAHSLAAAAEFVAPVPVVQAPKFAGETKREIWRAEVVDMVALCRAVADGLVDAANVEPNLPVLNKQASALKAALNIPGVRAVATQILASRAA